MTDLHPIAALDHVIESYRDFLRTEFRARDEKLREALEQAKMGGKCKSKKSEGNNSQKRLL